MKISVFEDCGSQHWVGKWAEQMLRSVVLKHDLLLRDYEGTLTFLFVFLFMMLC